MTNNIVKDVECLFRSKWNFKKILEKCTHPRKKKKKEEAKQYETNKK